MKAHLTASIAALAIAGLAQTAFAQNRPAQTTPAAPAQAQQQIQVNSVPVLCRIREQELIQINRMIGERNQALQKEADATKRQALGQQLQNAVVNLRETEASWQRMNCSGILYAARQ